MNFRSSHNNELDLKVGYIQENNFKTKLHYSFQDYNFYYYDRLNDFVKLRDERLAYLGNSTNSYLGIILIDLYNNFQSMKIRVFYFDFDNYRISKEIEAIIYNNYLAITSTVTSKKEKTNDDEKSFSMFLLFGYVNGTDDYINISKYINENEDSNSNNLVSDLTEKAIISNNIFGYEILIDQIKLVYIPDFILFYNKISENKQLKNDDILDKNYSLKNKGNSNNNSNNYLEYQIVITEADYDTFNNQASSIINCSMNNTAFVDEREFYNKKIFYGRTNTLTFIETISCHEYCLTCINTGNNVNDQKCLSCKEQYTYFYHKHFSLNCIPEGKFYDMDIKKIIDCNDTNSKFYIEDSGKRIFFKNNQDCPE